MKKWEKEILQNKVKNEHTALFNIEGAYKYALEEVKQKIAALQAKPQIQSVIYQLKYQNELKKQLEEVYTNLYTHYYSSVDDYLKKCYEDGFFSTMYSLQMQDVPIIIPFPQDEVAQMASVASDGVKLSKKIYSDVWTLNKVTREEISRGLATGASYIDIANGVTKRSEASFKQAKRIVVTEGHRVQEEVQFKTIMKAKEKGADIVKQWDSTLDKKTRKTHVELDGQLREVDQPFKIPSSGATAQYPGGFGIAKEDINCRCVSLQRARWALDKSEVDKMVGDLEGASEEQINALADKVGVSPDDLKNAQHNYIKAKNYNDFKKKYQKKADTQKTKLQSQLDVAKQEINDVLKPYGSENDLMVYGYNNEIEKYIKLKKKIDDLEIQLGLKVPPKATPKKVEPKASTPVSNPDHDELMKNAIRFNDGYSADKYHRDKNFIQDRWDNDLTENERKGIYTYTTNAYSDMNRALRSDKLKGSRYEKEIGYATEGLKKTLIAEDTVVFRGMGGADALSAWTGIPMNQLSDKAVQQGLIGTRLTEKAFMSTGTNAGSAWSGIKLEVYLPKGSQAMYVDPISRFSGEYEILVQRNSTFEIKEVKTDSRGYIEGLVLVLVEQKLP